MKELTIIMTWHDEADAEKRVAFEQNKQSFIDYNPGIDIVVANNPFGNTSKAWLSSDLCAFQWYSEHLDRYKSERYLIVEWDCWCDCNLKDYYQRVWDCDFVVPNVKYPERDDWYWFRTIDQLPEYAKLHATGVTPLCGIMLSNNAMQQIGKLITRPEFEGLNSELRLGTIGTMLNLDPVVNPVYNRSLNWRYTGLFDLKYKGLHHPRKKIANSREEPI